MIEQAVIIIVYCTYLILVSKRTMTYLHVLQQEDYDSARLWKWIKEHNAFDKRVTLGLILLTVINIVAHIFLPTIIDTFSFLMGFLVFLVMVIAINLEKDPRKNAKKRLVATDRAKRVFIPSILILALMGAWCFAVLPPFNTAAWPWIIAMQFIPFCVLLVNNLMKPFEMVTQKMYWNDARKKIQELKPIIIGVTGSFGKTSVKHILGHILSTQAPTLVTPGSVNTPMGITRIIREQLTADHKYFIVEMGAYGPGSIRDLCALCPPDFGIITAIGHAHYERFKSLDTVSQAKYELAEAVLEKGSGKVIVHERTLRFPYGRNIKVEHKDRFVVCGSPPNVDPKKNQETCFLEKDDMHIIDVKQIAKGLEIKIGIGNKSYGFEPALYGIHHGHNTVLAIAAAIELGIEIGPIQLALMSMPQISHRLEVKRLPADKMTIIDDAYNSNPIGFRSALDLMALIANGGRKILITPGMIELGIAHDEAHEQIGQYAGKICDVCIVVMPSRIPTFISGFKSAGSGTVVEVASFKEAQEWINNNKQDNDVILLENDLPDMYERIPKM